MSLRPQRNISVILKLLRTWDLHVCPLSLKSVHTRCKICLYICQCTRQKQSHMWGQLSNICPCKIHFLNTQRSESDNETRGKRRWVWSLPDITEVTLSWAHDKQIGHIWHTLRGDAVVVVLLLLNKSEKNRMSERGRPFFVSALSLSRSSWPAFRSHWHGSFQQQRQIHKPLFIRGAKKGNSTERTAACSDWSHRKTRIMRTTTKQEMMQFVSSRRWMISDGRWRQEAVWDLKAENEQLEPLPHLFLKFFWGKNNLKYHFDKLLKVRVKLGESQRFRADVAVECWSSELKDQADDRHDFQNLLKTTSIFLLSFFLPLISVNRVSLGLGWKGVSILPT